MRRVNYQKRVYLTKKKILFIIILIIFLNSGLFLYHFTMKLGDIILVAAEKELKEITQIVVGNAISKDTLPKVAVDDIIIANKNRNDEITDIDFKLDVAYDMMFELKGNLDLIVLAIKNGEITTKTTAINDRLIIKVPFYAYTNNPFLMNLGPKIHLQINMIEVVRGSVSTEVKNYGINSVLISVYLNIFISESILFPTNREAINLDYNILLASKVVQGKVPSLYTGKYETTSEIINVE